MKREKQIVIFRLNLSTLRSMSYCILRGGTKGDAKKICTVKNRASKNCHYFFKETKVLSVYSDFDRNFEEKPFPEIAPY